MTINSKISGSCLAFPTPPLPHPTHTKRGCVVTANIKRRKCNLHPRTQPPLFLKGASPKLLTIKLGKFTDVSQFRGDWNRLTHFHVGLSGRTVRLSPGSFPSSRSHPGAPDHGASRPMHYWVGNTSIHPKSCFPKVFQKEHILALGTSLKNAFYPYRGRRSVTLSMLLTHRALLSLCNTAHEAHCWKGGGDPPTKRS